MYYVSKHTQFSGKPICRACGEGSIELDGSAEKVKGPAPKGVKCAMCGHSLSYNYDPGYEACPECHPEGH